MFFTSVGIIDYSLLVGIHSRQTDQITNSSVRLLAPSGCGLSDRGEDPLLYQLPSRDGAMVYFLGIIDILTSFKYSKVNLLYCSQLAQGH